MGGLKVASVANKFAFELRNVIVEAYGVSAEDIEHASAGTFRQVTERGDVVCEVGACRSQHLESFEIELRLSRVLTGHLAGFAHNECGRLTGFRDD